MDKFFKSLKENLNNQPGPDFRESAWDAMQQKMQGAHTVAPTRDIFSPWIALLALFLLSSGILNLWLFNKIQNTSVPSEKETLTIQRDTIIQSKVFYKTDTIYIHQTEKKRIVKTLPQTFLSVEVPEFSRIFQHKNKAGKSSQLPSNIFGQFAEKKYSALYATDQHLNDNINSGSPFSTIQNSENNSLLFPEKESISKTAVVGSLTTRNINQLVHENTVEISTPEISINSIQKKRFFREQLHSMRPKALIPGIQGGWLYPLSEDLDRETNYMAGVNLDIAFSNSIRLFITADYLKLKFESEEIPPGLGLLDIPYPGDNFEFQNISVLQNSIQFAMGMKYMFNGNGRFHPYLGIGAAAVKVFPFQVIYEFDNEQIDHSIHLETEVNNTSDAFNQILFQGGLEYELNKHWLLRTNAFYRKALQKENINTLDVIGLQAGLNFKF